MKKKLINKPEDCVAECLEGFIASFGDKYEKIEGINGLKVKDPKEKVALVIGGGSGHEPMFEFFLGEGLADAAPCGNVFTSPDPGTIFETATSVNTGKGVLFLYGNYSGDNMNFDMAAEMMADIGIQSMTVRVKDDIASAPKDRIDDRRGIAGDVLVIKIAGAATASGLNLDECFRITSKANENTYTIGIGLDGATIPGQDNPIFTLPEDEIEFGLGIHGEPGVKRIKMLTADEIVEILFNMIIEDSGIKSGDEVVSYVNGLGSTTLMELYIINRKLSMLLKNHNIKVHDSEVNSYVTTQEMAGASISLMKLDEELKKYYDMPCNSVYYKK